MSAGVRSRILAALALGSGVPALAYEVVWTRQVALLAGAQVEAIAVVLAAFFGGLALGARVLGAALDRWPAPLRAYGALELAAAALAATTPAVFAGLRRLGPELPEASLPFLAAAALLPTTFLLGGTLPALLRAGVHRLPEAPYLAGVLAAANTAGAVLGVVLALWAIPALGLRATLLVASALAAALGALAWGLGQDLERPHLEPLATLEPERPLRRWALWAAAAAGALTLAFEVITARVAALLLGSSLIAWAAVLALVLAGLAGGNAALAPRAAGSPRPERDLGAVELAAALCVLLGLRTLAPDPGLPATGVGARTLLSVAVAVVPPAFFMGGAFPFFVRLATWGPALGSAFGSVSGWNTAGGILGSLLASFSLLPGLGPAGAMLACAAANGLLGLALLQRGGVSWLRLAVVGVVLAGAARLALPAAPRDGAVRLLRVAHGRQATAAVLAVGARRELVVDGDPEASTDARARRTEELLAVLPLVTHPQPRRLLEIGLGAGITLGAAARFPLESVECVEIAASVLEVAPLFEPDNRGVTRGDDPRVRIRRGDGRLALASAGQRYDVVLANTSQPWSLGATGLYSLEYFQRLSEALAPGGLAAQWLPVARIEAEALAAMVRTFFAVFPEGGVWWASEDLILLGSGRPLPGWDVARAERRLAAAGLTAERLGLSDVRELRRRRLGDAAAARAALGDGVLLRDDRPWLEARSARGSRAGPALAVALAIAERGAERDEQTRAIRDWLASRIARARGDEARADALESAAASLRLVTEARADRRLRRAGRALREGRQAEAKTSLREALQIDPGSAEARLVLARLAHQRGDAASAARELEALLDRHPEHAEAWNLRGVLHREAGETARARRAFTHALEAAPLLFPALANAGLLAVERGDRDEAERLLARLRALDARQRAPETRALAAALSAGAPGSPPRTREP